MHVRREDMNLLWEKVVVGKEKKGRFNLILELNINVEEAMKSWQQQDFGSLIAEGTRGS